MKFTQNYEESFYPRIVKEQLTDDKRKQSNMSFCYPFSIHSLSVCFPFCDPNLLLSFCHPFWVFTSDFAMTLAAKARTESSWIIGQGYFWKRQLFCQKITQTRSETSEPRVLKGSLPNFPPSHHHISFTSSYRPVTSEDPTDATFQSCDNNAIAIISINNFRIIN